MSQKQNRFFCMIHDAIGKARLIVVDQGDVIVAGDIFCGNYDEFVPRHLGAKGDLPDSSSRNAAAHGRPVDHVRKSEIVDVAGVTGDLITAFLARCCCTDDTPGLQAGSFYALSCPESVLRRNSFPHASPGNLPSTKTG